MGFPARNALRVRWLPCNSKPNKRSQPRMEVVNNDQVRYYAFAKRRIDTNEETQYRKLSVDVQVSCRMTTMVFRGRPMFSE